MVMIYTALLCEAQSIIEKYRLNKIHTNPTIYANELILVVVGGIGKEKTVDALEFIFQRYEINRAFNIGIAGCSDKSVAIGELFCTNHRLDGMQYMELQTVPKPQKEEKNTKSLYDMEGKYFLEVAEKYLESENIFVFKVVSDYLDDTILPKDTVKKMIQKSLGSLEKWI